MALSPPPTYPHPHTPPHYHLLLPFGALSVPRLQAQALGLPRDTPLLQVLVDEAAHDKGETPSTQGEPFPLPKPLASVATFTTSPLGHFNYAIGWASMAATMAYLARQVLRSGRGGRRGPR